MTVPGNILSVAPKIVTARQFKFAVGQCHVKGIFLRPEICGPKSIPVVGIIDAAIIRLPILVPVTDIIWDEGILGI